MGKHANGTCGTGGIRSSNPGEGAVLVELQAMQPGTQKQGGPRRIDCPLHGEDPEVIDLLAYYIHCIVL